jgi:hypothetical protein
MRNLVAFIGLAFALVACAAESGPDLPEGWADAERIESFEQSQCSRSALSAGAPAEAMEWNADDAGLKVDYRNAHFRCEQAVEGFVRRSSDAIDLLVQPVDMVPTAVAGCDCLYGVSMELQALPGEYTLKLFRRWDNLNDPNPLVEIGTARVSEP